MRDMGLKSYELKVKRVNECRVLGPEEKNGLYFYTFYTCVVLFQAKICFIFKIYNDEFKNSSYKSKNLTTFIFTETLHNFMHFPLFIPIFLQFIPHTFLLLFILKIFLEYHLLWYLSLNK